MRTRQRSARRVLDQDVAATSRYYGISGPTFYKWRSRYEQLGPNGLRDRSSRPHHSPHKSQLDHFTCSLDG